MRYRLRTLLILMAVGPALIGGAAWLYYWVTNEIFFGGGLGNVPMQTEDGDRSEPPWGNPNATQEEKLRVTRWNVQVLFHMDDMERAGKTEQEIDEYRKANYDKPPKTFKFDD